MKQEYISKSFQSRSLRLIEIMDGIIVEYQKQGYVLTVRQLYYQLVARGIIENTIQSYKNTASIVNDAKLAGLLDWNAIEDRTREFIRKSKWNSGSEILSIVANEYHEDMWVNQSWRVFVVVEKEALAGVLEGVCREFDVPLLAARGYPSGTVLREFSELDLIPALDSYGQDILILHLGDHDPSGIDMTRDLTERLELFTDHQQFCNELNIQRIALNMNQVEEIKPPENPAKSTDSRYMDYRKKFGGASWELDALEPSYLNNLVRNKIEEVIDFYLWDEKQNEIDEIKKSLLKVSQDFKKQNI